MPEITVQGQVGGKDLSFSTGKLALQADGAVAARIGETEVLVTATASKTMREGVDFFPLTVDFEERMYAVGKIPGSFFRREGRATEAATLAARLIDRPLRPSFAEGFRCETHVVALTLAFDGENPHDVLALNAASAALMISGIPFEGPIGGTRLALKKGEWVPFPTHGDLEEAVFELVVAGGRNAAGGIDIIMVEAGSTPHGLRLIAAGDPPSDEATVASGLEVAKTYISQAIDLQLQLVERAGRKEAVWPLALDYQPELYSRIESAARPRLVDVIRIAGKQERNEAEVTAREAVFAELAIAEEDAEAAKRAWKDILKDMMRARVVEEGVRLDGRGPEEIRPLQVEVGVVGRTHGSALFQRGETQVLNITTLGMLKMEQMLDTLALEDSKRFMHHYNMPPFATGEAGFMRGPKRREIGHGALAEKALLPVVPEEGEFPYALRLVSEVISSNGSTSMASVCGSSLSLMDAGVPISHPVAGIAMGLIERDGKYVTLTDILGAEDALGDMDFKVAGTADVITALQLDTKLSGLPSEVLTAALDQARVARLKILEAMNAVIPTPRSEMNRWAPRIESIQIPKDKIGEVIGPKGKVVRELEEQTGATIEIEEEAGYGIVRIASADGDALAAAKERVMNIVFPPEAELGKEYEGEVVNITKFGAFVNILPGRDGLLHISKLDSTRRVERVEDYLELGQRVPVIVEEIDPRTGKLALQLARPLEGVPREGAGASGNGPPREDRPRDRGDRNRDRGGRDRGDRDRGDRNRGDRAPDTRTTAEPGGERRRPAVSFEDTFEDLRRN
ncbi:MAG TPA: polyribonucleotide nucleotidyltransferase [Acidimicrobiia bacterium]|nr:polyribonucleotide nucleotidyltransferase [Acidimicrobiia bacterium]